MNPEQKAGGATGRKTYTEEFKRSVVDHWCNNSKTAAQVAREFGIHEWNLRDWKACYGYTPKPVDAPIPDTPQAMARELQQLRKELARVKMQREILKKTMAILAEDPRSLTA